jgi:sugar phosphate isomerase/epimerase
VTGAGEPCIHNHRASALLLRWHRQPLDRGSFDVAGLLETLDELGYTGPIGLQCFGIGGDAREHLACSMAAWRKSPSLTGSCPQSVNYWRLRAKSQT